MTEKGKNQAEYWKALANRIVSPAETKNKRPDTSDLEIEFLKDYLKETNDILDLGSGSGLIVNKLVDYVSSIIAVEKFESFTKFIVDDPKITVINSDLIGFKIRRQFDAVLLFGVAQSFYKDDIIAIYKNIYNMIKPSGLFIIRIHCGLEEDILVDGFSEELQTNYFAHFRQIDSEIKLLEEIGFKNIKKFDIFPDSLNVWENSRHFLLVCEK
jgi:SAM-dependent methyltransferase